MSITLDEHTKRIMLEKLKGKAGETNRQLYEFAVSLYNELKDRISADSLDEAGNKITQSSILEELASEPNMPSNDAGALRQMKEAGKFVKEEYNEDIDYVVKVGYWTFHNVARARFVKDNDELNTQLKKETINRIIEKDLPSGKVKAEIRKIKIEYNPPVLDDLIEVYNQWTFLSPDPRFGDDWPGRIPGQIVLNVIYHYLDKYQTLNVLDPMAGGGSTADVCSYLSSEHVLERDRYDVNFLGFDIHPSSFNSEKVEIEHIVTPGEVYLNDDGIVAQDEDHIVERTTTTKRNIIEKDAVVDEWNVEGYDLVFIDPPYFNQVGERYLENAFTKSRESFYSAIAIVIQKSYESLKEGGLLAIIISPQTEKSIDFAGGEVCMDMPYEIMKIMEDVGFTTYTRIQVPLSTQQFGPQDVNRAKKYEERQRLLGTARDLIIMRK